MGTTDEVVVGEKHLAALVNDLAERHRGHVATVRPTLAASGWNLDFCLEGGFLEHLGIGRHFEGYIADAPIAWTTWDPVHIAPSDRNRAQVVDNRLFRSLDVIAKVYEPMGLVELSHMVATLSDGPHLLSWIGIWREESFEDRELVSFQSSLKAIRKTLRAMRRFGYQRLTWRSILVLIEAIHRPAFLLRDDGSIEYANRAAQRLVAVSGRTIVRHLVESLNEPMTSEQSEYELTPLSSRGMPRFHIAIQRERPASFDARIRCVADHWKLTSRQVDVLRRLVHGASNKELATDLACSERTVEIHVASICAKAGVQGRTAVVARFWMFDV